MFCKDLSFDATITDSKGRSIEVDCVVSEPIASGLAATIEIEIPLNDKKQFMLENPCSLRGAFGALEIKIEELWYRSISVGATQRKHARGSFKINHAGELRIHSSNFKSAQPRLRFLLSPIRFFKSHSSAVMIDYSATPDMSVELFRLRLAGLGELRFIKFWTIHSADEFGVSAEVRASFAAELVCEHDILLHPEDLLEKLKIVLTGLSIFTRQAITVHGWIFEKPEGLETVWLVPLNPNLAPDMGEEPHEDMNLEREFESSAQAFIEKLLSAPADKQEAITLISVALAPHVPRSPEGNISALFGTLEAVVSLERVTKDERSELRRSDPELIAELNEMHARISQGSSPNAMVLLARIDGFLKSVESSGPSFKVRFEKFRAAYPSLATYMADLWPLWGTDRKPGLKQIRDSLAHGLRREHTMSAIVLAHWHFARLAERLAFVLVGAEMPSGLRLNSPQLLRDSWYHRSTWEPIQIAAKLKN